MRRSLLTVAAFALMASATRAQVAGSVNATPMEPIAAIVDAFRSHALVAIGDHHGNEQIHRFRLALIRDPRFAAAVNDIVVEFGNARYQDLMDRFVRGEDIADDALQRVWQDTTQVEYDWDLPIYEEFFRAVRAVNAALPRDSQLRVLLGDPPIDWTAVRTRDDIFKWASARDTHAADLIRTEVLAKGRRALLIYGDQHLIRKNAVIGANDEWARGLVAQLERPSIASVFTIYPETRTDLTTLQADVASWPIPSLATIRATPLGTPLFTSGPRQRSVRVEEQFDAVLYLGRPSVMTMARLATALCADSRYMDMRLARLALVGAPPGAPMTPADSLRAYCAHPEGENAIADREPAITDLLRRTLNDAARGEVEPNAIAPESQAQLIPFLRERGPRFLGLAGALESLTLLADTSDGARRFRRYRAVFANGQRIVWTVGLSPAGTILSLDPRPE